MLKDYLYVFLMSMVPIIELRGAVPLGEAMDLNYWITLVVCVVGNLLPVPLIYFFARRVLLWGANKRFIGKFFSFCLRKGERAGQKLTKTAGQRGLFLSLLLFVAIPIPGTGAWTGTLGASFMNMGFKRTTLAVCLGVIIAGIIMGIFSKGVAVAVA